jgi:hypothetical protein
LGCHGIFDELKSTPTYQQELSQKMEKERAEVNGSDQLSAGPARIGAHARGRLRILMAWSGLASQQPTHADGAHACMLPRRRRRNRGAAAIWTMEAGAWAERCSLQGSRAMTATWKRRRRLGGSVDDAPVQGQSPGCRRGRDSATMDEGQRSPRARWRRRRG